MRPAILLMLMSALLFGGSPAFATDGSVSASLQCQNISRSDSASGTGSLTETVNFGDMDAEAYSYVAANEIVTGATGPKFSAWAGAAAGQNPVTALCQSQSAITHTQSYDVRFPGGVTTTNLLLEYDLGWKGVNQGGSAISATLNVDVLLDGNFVDSGSFAINQAGQFVPTGIFNSPTIEVEQVGTGAYQVEAGGALTIPVTLPMTAAGMVEGYDFQLLVDAHAGLLTGTNNVTVVSDLGNGFRYQVQPVTDTVIVTGTPVMAAVSTPQTKKQQNCINEQNKQASKLIKVTNKELLWCVQQRLKGKPLGLDPLTSPTVPYATLDLCASLQGDPRGKKVKQLFNKADKGISNKCFSDKAAQCDPNNPNADCPDFVNPGVPGSFNRFIDGSINQPVTGVAYLFQNDLENLIQESSVAPDNGKCQAEVIKNYNKVIDTAWKEILKAKKAGLGGKKGATPAGVSDDLTQQLQAAIRDNDKVAKAISKLLKNVTKQCKVSESQGQLHVLVPACAATQTTHLAACVSEQAVCRATKGVNKVDGTSLEVDLVDNGLPDGSCIH